MINKTIIFDFGGVLIDWNPRYVYRNFFNTEEEMEWFLGNICTAEWNLKIDAGKSFAESVKELSDIHPHWVKEIEAFHIHWEDMLGGEILETVEILREIQDRGYRVYGLTNWSAETFPIAFERYKFLQTLNGIVVSGEEKVVKPDPAIFRILLERYDLVPGNCIFIDDNLLNVSAARELGFGVIHHITPGQLREELCLH